MIPSKYPLGTTRNDFEIKFHATLILGKESPWPWALSKSASFCLALTLVKPTASGFYPTQNCSKIMNRRLLDYADFQKLMTKSKKCPTLVITHNLIGPYNKIFQNLPPFFQ
jgi:hypothetical protein